MASTQDRQPFVEDCSDEDGPVSFQGRNSPTAANVSTKRSHPSDLDKEKPPAVERVPANVDVRSDSGYSSYTAATVSSTNSAPSATSQPGDPRYQSRDRTAPTAARAPSHCRALPPNPSPRGLPSSSAGRLSLRSAQSASNTETAVTAESTRPRGHVQTPIAQSVARTRFPPSVVALTSNHPNPLAT
jgi:hypothetical protein